MAPFAGSFEVPRAVNVSYVESICAVALCSTAQFFFFRVAVRDANAYLIYAACFVCACYGFVANLWRLGYSRIGYGSAVATASSSYAFDTNASHFNASATNATNYSINSTINTTPAGGFGLGSVPDPSGVDPQTRLLGESGAYAFSVLEMLCCVGFCCVALLVRRGFSWRYAQSSSVSGAAPLWI